MHLQSKLYWLYAFTLAAILMVAAFGVYIFQNDKSRATAEGWTEHSDRVIKFIPEMQSEVNRADMTGRLAIVGLNGDPAHIAEARESAFEQIKTLEEITSDNPTQKIHVEEYRAALQSRFALQDTSRATSKIIDGRIVQSQESAQASTAAIARLEASAHKIQSEEYRLLTYRLREQKNTAESRSLWAWRFLFIFAICLLISGAFAYHSLRLQGRASEPAKKLKQEIEYHEGKVIPAASVAKMDALIKQIDATLTG